MYESVVKLHWLTSVPLQVSEDELQKEISEAKDSKDPWAKSKVWSLQYHVSWGIRGDNVPEYAKYLGYLDTKNLYPDMKWTTLETFVAELLEGKGIAPYQHKTRG